MRLLSIHLAAVMAGVLVAATAATFPGWAKWTVVVAAVCAMLNAGAVVAELV